MHLTLNSLLNMKHFTSPKCAIVGLLLGLIPPVTNAAPRLSNWAKWVQNPPTVPVSVSITNLYADSGTLVHVTLADGFSDGYGHPDGCGQPTNAPTLFANANVPREYLLTVVATNLQQVELQIHVNPPWQLLSKNGSDSVPKAYSILIDRQVRDRDTVTAYTNCTYFSNSWIVEIRDQQGAHWIVDDQSNDPGPAPGDANPLQIGPAKSLLTNRITIDWSVSLGRLYDGLAAGRLRLSESSLSREAYTPKAIFYAAASTNVRSQVELVCAQADGALRQAKAFQCFVDVIDPWTFSVSDLTDLHSLAGRLAAETNGVSLYVFNHLPSVTQQTLTNYYYGTNSAAEPLQSMLVHDFNALVAGPSMYDLNFWTNVTFSEETQFLLAQDAQGPDLLRLNRLLLQDAYTTQIAQRPYQTALNFYLPAQVGASTNQDGVYTNITGSPFVSHYVRNPQPTATTNLALVEARNGISYTNTLVFSPQSGSDTWVLTSGAGSEQKRETRGIGFSYGAATHRFETNTVRYVSSSTNAYKCVEDYELLGWGWELVKTTVDPSGANLVTAFEFYQDTDDNLNYSKPSIVRYPDGNWEVRLYDHDQFPGALQYVLRPFNDSPQDPQDADRNNCEAALYDYSPISSTKTTYYVTHYFGDPWYGIMFKDQVTSGSDDTFDEQVELRAHYGEDDGELGTDSLRGADGLGKGLAGHEFSVSDDRGPKHTMCYEGGTFDASSGTFTVNGGGVAAGPDWRQFTLSWNWIYYETDPNSHLSWVVLDHFGTQGPACPSRLRIGRSLRAATIYQNGSPVQRENAVFTGLGSGDEPQFAPFQRYAYKNDALGHTTNIASTQLTSQAVICTIYESSYLDSNGKDGQLLRWEADATGARTEYSYDSLKRLAQARRVGVTNALASIPTMATNITYDAAGRVTLRAVVGADLALTTHWCYDAAGRLMRQVCDNGLTTNYAYSFGSTGGQVVTTTLPGGATIVREQYIDRRLKSQTGTAVIAEFHTNGVVQGPAVEIPLLDTNHWGSAQSPRWTVTGYDDLCLPALARKPDFDGLNVVEQVQQRWEWLDTPAVVEVTGKASTSYQADFDGQVCQTSQGSWAPPYDGRVSAITRQYINVGGSWFLTETNLAYLADASNAATVTGVRLERLSGFTSQNVLSEVTTVDADSNPTLVTTFVDRAARQVTEITTPPQSTLTPTKITVNGLLVIESTATVATPAVHHYDALGRETSVTSPLGFTASRTYNEVGQVSSETDFTGLCSTYEYYPNGSTGAGQLKSQTGSGKKTYYSYTPRGELWRTWGHVPYPEERVYSQYGELVQLHTYRGDSGWNQPSWPASPGSADTTTWTYQDTSGLLLQKTDHAGNSVAYTYENGMLKTRSWARLTGGEHVTTTYDYNGFGDLTAQYYNDGTTPAVYLNDFNRAGQPRQIVDGSGISSLLYDHASRLVATEYTSGLLAGITVTNHFDSLGRRNSLAALNGVTPLLQHAFGYDDYSRIRVVSTGPYSATYDYLPNSDLLQTTTCRNTNNSTPVLTTTRSWDYGVLLHSIVNVTNGATVSSHTYTYDALNRRSQALLEDGSAWNYNYNDRDELIGAHRYWPDSSPVAGQQYGYTYDSIGNRHTASSGGDSSGSNLRTETYTANGLNEYTSRSVPGWVQTIGAANSSANVALCINNGGCAPASRKGEYFRAEVSVGDANANGPVWLSLTNLAALPGGGSADLLTSASGHVLLPQSQQTFTYDLDGNLTGDGIWTYEWDGENRLVAMTMTDVANITDANRLRLEFAYDFLGRRVQKRVYHASSGDWVLDSDSRFVYNGWNLIAILDSQSSILQSFVWGLDLSRTMDQAGGVGGLLLAAFNGSSPTICFPAYDGNGNVTALINSLDQSTSARYEYSPCGEMVRATGPIAAQNPFGFSTKFRDDQSALIYFGCRYYSPALGRWIGRDSTGEGGGNNLYCFVKNSSTCLFDPNGCKAMFLAGPRHHWIDGTGRG